MAKSKSKRKTRSDKFTPTLHPADQYCKKIKDGPCSIRPLLNTSRLNGLISSDKCPRSSGPQGLLTEEKGYNACCSKDLQSLASLPYLAFFIFG